MHGWQSIRQVGCLLLAWLCLTAPVRGATQQEIDAAINRAREALKKMWTAAAPGGPRTLTAVALIKAGEPHDSPIEKAEIENLRKKVRNGVYSAVGNDAIYIAGVEAMLIADIQDEAVRTELMAPVANFILANQRANGSWDYIGGAAENRNTDGDTSVTQYACLGLWSAQRAGIEIPPTVWEKVINWHVQTVAPDGAVMYTPKSGSPRSPQMAVNSLSSIHIAVLQLNPSEVPKLLEGGTIVNRPVAVPKDEKKFGVLEAVPLDNTRTRRPKVTNVVISQGAGTACQKVYRTVLPAIHQRQIDAGHMAYYLYSLERLAALADRKDFDGYDWYADNADMLVKTQGAGGTWTSSLLGESIDSSFALMFLVRATGKLLNREAPVTKRIGGGLLAGGRGLPDNLAAPAKPVRKSSPLGDLLASLEKANVDALEEAQEELVEKIQLGDRKELVGNKDLILRLLKHPTPAVRQTAVWALGRTNDLSLARYLVRALEDKDPAVRVEAHNALCWLTRNPTAHDIPADPLADVPEDAPAEARTAAQSAWQREAFLAWGAWYLDHRPFADRGDDFETWLRGRLRALK